MFKFPHFSFGVCFCVLQVLGADLAILDEIDSGLDVDALRDVAKAVNGLLTPKNSLLMITHYRRLLEFIKPTFIHIMVSQIECYKITLWIHICGGVCIRKLL